MTGTARHVAHPHTLAKVAHTAPSTVCSAPLQALRAMRALAGLPAAALLSGGLALGAAGAGLGSLGSSGGYGGGGFGGGGSGTRGSASTGAISTASTPVDMGDGASPMSQLLLSSPSGVPTTSVVTRVGQDQILSVLPSMKFVQPVRTPVIAPGDTAVPDTVPDQAVQPPRTLNPDVPDKPTIVDVPEPAGIAWCGFAAVLMLAVVTRHRARSTRSD